MNYCRPLQYCFAVVAIAASALLLVAGGGLIIWLLSGGRLYSVQTGSMKPLIKPGDAVLTSRLQPQQLRPGDIVSYRDATNPGVVVTHRIVAIDSIRRQVITKGDNNPQADLPIGESQVVGRVDRLAQHLGTLLSWLRRPIGMILCVYLPAALLCLNILLRLNVRPNYRLRR